MLRGRSIRLQKAQYSYFTDSNRSWPPILIVHSDENSKIIRYEILFETPLQFDCKQSNTDVYDSSIVAELFLPRNYALSYYLWIQKNISILLGVAVILGMLNIWLDSYLLFHVFCSICLFSIPIVIFPPCYVSIFKKLCVKFDFIFLFGNIAIFQIVDFFMMKDYGFGFYVELSRAVSWFLANVSLLVLDAIPVEILSHKGKTYFFMMAFFVYFNISIRLSFMSPYEKATGRTWKYRIGNQEWDLASISATCFLNLTLFIGRIAWTAITQPGYFTIIRSWIKQKSLVPLIDKFIVKPF